MVEEASAGGRCETPVMARRFGDSWEGFGDEPGPEQPAGDTGAVAAPYPVAWSKPFLKINATGGVHQIADTREGGYRGQVVGHALLRRPRTIASGTPSPPGGATVLGQGRPMRGRGYQLACVSIAQFEVLWARRLGFELPVGKPKCFSSNLTHGHSTSLICHHVHTHNAHTVSRCVLIRDGRSFFA